MAGSLSTAIWTGAALGAVVSLGFAVLEIRKMQTPAFAASAEARVAQTAERAVFTHLSEGYGLSASRIASIQVFANAFSRR